MSYLRTSQRTGRAGCLEDARGRWGNPRIHWSSMLFSVKRVLENRAKPSRYSQARSGMYYGGGRNGEREKGRRINSSTFTPPGFCTCCFLHLKCSAFFPTSSCKNLLKHQPSLVRSPPSWAEEWGWRDAEGNKINGPFLCSTITCDTRQTVSSRRAGAEPVLDTPISYAQHIVP